MGWPGQEMRMLGDAEKVFLGRDSIKCLRELVKSQKKKRLLFITFLVNMWFEKDFLFLQGVDRRPSRTDFLFLFFYSLFQNQNYVFYIWGVPLMLVNTKC